MTKKRSNYPLGFLIIIALLLVAWQYTVFENDHRRLQQTVDVLESSFASLQDTHLLPQLKDKLDLTKKRISPKIPTGDTQDLDFLRGIRTTCLLNHSICHLLGKNSILKTYNNDKEIVFEIKGPKKDIQEILVEIENSTRLLSWNEICLQSESSTSEDITLHVSFVIYHFPHLTFQGREKLHRPEFETNAWLPPFTYYLNKTREKAETIYDLLMITPNTEEQLNALREYRWEKERLDRMESVLATLTNNRKPLSIERDYPICN